ncbi:ROK family protein [Candidatus Poribacteria bacterium]|nr:ROK family protein [Candidatus Poribacteria bacterium]
MNHELRTLNHEPSVYIGIDIGATEVKTGLVTRQGTLVSKERHETAKIASPAHFLDILNETVHRLLQSNALSKQSVGGIGIGAPGWVDYPHGIVRELTNIPGWRDVPIVIQLQTATGLKSFVDNDANVMAVGELIHGAGRGHENFVCLTLGTGVGGAIVVDGKLYRGANGLAGEIGHMILDLNGPECACGARGCLERYVGNRFIIANALRKLEALAGPVHENILLSLADNRPDKITPKILAEAAARGDALSLDVWRETGHYLGVALSVLVNLLNPECFIIGGGVARAGSVLFDPMRDTAARLAMNQLGKTTPIMEAELKEDAGLIGAATFALTCLEKAC